MSLFDDSPDGRWMFVFPHPDDELALVAWIGRLTKDRIPIRIVWLHSTPIRESESRTAMKSLGIDGSCLVFLDGKDGRLHLDMNRLTDLVGDEIRAFRPTNLVVPAFEQGHIDHDATNYIVTKAVETVSIGAIAVAEYPAYHPYTVRLQAMGRFADPTGESMLRLTSDEIGLKKQLSRAYPSQSIRRVLVWYHVWRWITFRPASLARTERMRIKPQQDYLQPTVEQRMKAKVCRSTQWQEWIDAVQRDRS